MPDASSEQIGAEDAVRNLTGFLGNRAVACVAAQPRKCDTCAHVPARCNPVKTANGEPQLVQAGTCGKARQSGASALLGVDAKICLVVLAARPRQSRPGTERQTRDRLIFAHQIERRYRAAVIACNIGEHACARSDEVVCKYTE